MEPSPLPIFSLLSRLFRVGAASSSPYLFHFIHISRFSFYHYNHNVFIDLISLNVYVSTNADIFCSFSIWALLYWKQGSKCHPFSIFAPFGERWFCKRLCQRLCMCYWWMWVEEGWRRNPMLALADSYTNYTLNNLFQSEYSIIKGDRGGE